MVVSLQLLGRPQVARDRAPVAGPKGRKTWGLLAYLLLCDVAPSRQRAAALLFPGTGDPLAALRWTLADARRLLGGDVDVGGDPLRLALPASAAVDVTVLRSGRWSEASGLPSLGRDLLEGQTFASAPAFELWLEGERRHLRAESAAVLHEAGLASLAVGEVEQALGHAARLVDLDPLDENNHVLLVRCLAAAGEVHAAETAARAAEKLMRSELGVEPTSGLRTAARTPVVEETFIATPAAVTAQLEAGQAAIDAGSWAAALNLLRQAVATARRVADTQLRARALVTLGAALVHAARGFDEEGSAALHEGAGLARQTGDRLLAATACRELGYVEFLRARYGRARRWLADATEFADGHLEEIAWARLIEGACHSDVGSYTQAGAALREAVALAEAEGLERAGAFALSFLGRWHLLQGDLPAAERCLSSSIRSARADGWTSFVPWPEALLGEVQLLQGDLDAATSTFQHAYTMGQQLGDVCWESMGMRGLGLVAARDGDVDRAVTLLEQAPRRCLQLPDSYLWIVAYGLDALSSTAATYGLASLGRWVEELERVAAQAGLRELRVRALLHRARGGDEGALAACHALGPQIDNPALHSQIEEFAH